MTADSPTPTFDIAHLPVYGDAILSPMDGFSDLPFRGLVDAPLRLYLGHIPISGLAGALAHQFLWVFVTVAFGRWLLARGVRRLVVQGG